ncbi:hypothetical protein OA508_00180 [Candidatus Pelagibacter sp.]|nr:hypothetical protein [Candidatus Pelagibacter sp.]
MVKRRTTPDLNLQKELPQVLSTDFNLFYKPEQAPVDKSVDQFTKSLDAFISGAGTDLVIAGELKEKKTNEAQAIKDYNENRDKFSKQVETGSIPKEANPYYIEKLQELHLNKKAEEFKIQAYRNYAKAKLNKNTNVGAFDSYYEDELKNFVSANQLGTFSPEKLEKGFFSKTSGTRNSLAQTHAQNQLIAIGEEFDVLFKENIQSILASDEDMQTRGERITLFIQDTVKNGAGKLSTRNLFLSALGDYLKTTSDFEEAERIIHLLPSMVNLSGLGALGDVNALKNDFDKLKEDLDDRKILFNEKKIRKQKAIDGVQIDGIYKSLDKYEDIEEYKASPEYPQLSEENKKKADSIYANHFSGYAQKTNDQSRSEVEQLILKSDFEGARNYLVDNQSQFTEAEHSKLRNEVLILDATKGDGLITHELFEAFRDKIETNLKAVNKASPTGTPLVNPALALTFEKEMRQWLKDNPPANFPSDSARQKAFLEEVQTRSQAYQNVISKGEVPVVNQVPDSTQTTESKTEVADLSKLNKNPDKTLASEVSIPVNKISNNGEPFTKLSDVQKLMDVKLTGEEIKRRYEIDFPINEKSLFSPIKE